MLLQEVFSPDYQNWFNRFARISNAYKLRLFKQTDIIKLQLFLLDYGQFNANFILEELRRLQYPLSPFVNLHHHTYLRSTDTWAMEILRLEYHADHDKKLFPIFLDSELFWQELDRYCVLVDDPLALDQNKLRAIILFHADQAIWLKLNNPDQKNQVLKIIENTLLESRLQHSVPEVLWTVFKNPLKKNLNQETIAALNQFFQAELEQHSQAELSNKQRQIDEGQRNQKWYQMIFGMAKQIDANLLTNIKNPQELQRFAEDPKNNNKFENLLNVIRENIPAEQKLDPGVYFQLIAQWKSETIKPQLNNFIYCTQQQIHGIEAIVFIDHKDADKEHWFAKAVINNMGYRLDPVKSIREILKRWPLLFFDAVQTQNFWERFMAIPMICELAEEQKSELINLGKKIIQQIHENPLVCHYDCKLTKKDITAIDNTIPDEIENAFHLYAKFIADYLFDYLKQNSKDSGFKFVIEPEIKFACNEFLKACQTQNLSLAIRAVQVISELMLLDLGNRKLNNSLFSQIKNSFLKNVPVQAVLLTSYAMRAFVRVFQILDAEYRAKTPKIVVTNQSYFEWLNTLNRLELKGRPVSLVRHTPEITADADVIFVEIHPNNVTETKQFAHDLKVLLKNMRKPLWQTKKRTLVIDATLNALDDEELRIFFDKARILVNKGWLNIILIQSLTKFSQLGLDKRSGGLVIVINNNHGYWYAVNQQATKLQSVEIVDPSTAKFFNYMLEFSEFTQYYINRVNYNVRYTYKRIMKQFNQLEIISNARFQITMSSDPKACYIALNMRGLLPEADPGCALKIDDIEQFSRDVLHYLIQPLCDFFQLPLTERMSIGFPLCSVNRVFDSMRFTIGIELKEQLIQYADILAYTAFVLNRQRNAKLFFEKNARGVYQLRVNYFAEKVDQFKALTPDYNYAYQFEFDSTGYENRYRDHVTNQDRQLRRSVTLNNGAVQIFRELHPSYPDHNTQFQVYPADRIDVPLRAIGYRRLSDPEVSVAYKRMTIACLTQYCCSDEVNHQNINLLFDNWHGTVSFESMEIIGLRNANFIYGPFNINKTSLFFGLHHTEIVLYFNNIIYSEEAIMVRLGNHLMPLVDMPLEDREFTFREGCYQIDRFPRNFISAYPNQTRPESEFIPLFDKMKVTIESHKCIIEQDFLCAKINGIAISKRLISQSATCITIDYWQEKNPVLSRFLTLMIAIFVKDAYGVSFIARNTQFQHFLFNLAFDAADQFFQEAALTVSANKEQLAEMLKNYNRGGQPMRAYSFFSRDRAELTWPSGYVSVQEIKESELIESALQLLKK